MVKKLLIICFLLFSTLNAITVIAQLKKISGNIVDENGKPITNATVRIKGRVGGKVADENGKFTIEVKSGQSIIVNAINFKQQEVKINDETEVINIVLVDAGASMEDVVVTTAGGIKTKRKEIGTATTVIKGESVNAGASPNLAGGLQGKVPGLLISNTSGGVNPTYRLVLRGQRSLTGNNQALIVLDNVIVPNSVMGNINPEDIEDITILNGSGAAALYGSQASNGAVIVTTKKGKNGVLDIKFQQTVTSEQVAFWPKLQTEFGSGGSSYGFDVNGNPVFANMENQSYGPKYDGSKKPLGYPLEDGSQDSAIYSNNNSKKDFWQNGLQNQSDLSISTGNDVSTVFFSGQWFNAKGTTPGDKYNRASLRLNGTRKFGKMLLLTYSTSYTQNRYNITTATGSIYNDLLNIPSWIPITSFKDWQTNKFANPNGYYNPWYGNPYFIAADQRSLQRNDYFTGNAELRFTPIEGLDLVARQGIATRNYSNKNYTMPFDYTEYATTISGGAKADIAASVSDGSNYTTELLSDLFAQFKHSINNNFDINAIGGMQWKQDQAKYVGVSAGGLVIPDVYNVGTGVGTPGASESNYLARQIGLYGDVRIGYKGYLYLHGTARNDWVSILAPGNRAIFYPAVDVSFIATDALQALKSSSIISYLKIRGGWSKVGQVNLGNSSDFGAYYLLPTYSQASGYPYGSIPGYTHGTGLVSLSLKPEITKGYEGGFDLNLFKDRVTTTFTYYSTKTDNQTVNTYISSTTGYSRLLTNTGETSSNGIELSMNVNAIKTKDWDFNIGSNYTHNHNIVNNISSSIPNLAIAQYSDNAGSYAVAGQAFPVIMGYDYLRDPQGHVIVDAKTGEPQKDDQIKILGNAQPKDILGLNLSLRYKSFRLSALFEYRGGYKIYNAGGPTYDWAGVSIRTTAYDRQPFIYPNSVYLNPSTGQYVKNTSVLLTNANGNAGFWTDQDLNMGITSNYVTSGDFWKLREIALSYTFTSEYLKKTNFIKSLTISLQARNLFEWLSKDNIYTDPEYSDAGGDSNGIGLTNLNQSPPSRFFGGSVSINF